MTDSKKGGLRKIKVKNSKRNSVFLVSIISYEEKKSPGQNKTSFMTVKPGHISSFTIKSKEEIHYVSVRASDDTLLCIDWPTTSKTLKIFSDGSVDDYDSGRVLRRKLRKKGPHHKKRKSSTSPSTNSNKSPSTSTSINKSPPTTIDKSPPSSSRSSSRSSLRRHSSSHGKAPAALYDNSRFYKRDSLRELGTDPVLEDPAGDMSDSPDNLDDIESPPPTAGSFSHRTKGKSIEYETDEGRPEGQTFKEFKKKQPKTYQRSQLKEKRPGHLEEKSLAQAADRSREPGAERSRTRSGNRSRDRSRVPGTDRSRVPGTDRSRVPGTDQSRVPDTDRSRVPGTDRSRVPGTDRSRVPGTDRSRVPGTDRSRVPGTDRSRTTGGHRSRVPGVDISRVPGVDRSWVPGGDRRGLPVITGLPISRVPQLESRSQSARVAGPGFLPVSRGSSDKSLRIAEEMQRLSRVAREAHLWSSGKYASTALRVRPEIKSRENSIDYTQLGSSSISSKESGPPLSERYRAVPQAVPQHVPQHIPRLISSYSDPIRYHGYSRGAPIHHTVISRRNYE